jgi:predicted negative regulator of RcsB-dependent stress response
VFSKEIERVLVVVERSGKVAIVVIAVAIAVYFAVRWWRRRSSVKASG